MVTITALMFFFYKFYHLCHFRVCFYWLIFSLHCGSYFPSSLHILNFLLNARHEISVFECQYYCPLLNILELYSKLQLNYLERVWPFKAFLLSCVETRVAFKCRAKYSHCLGHTFPNAFCMMNFFSLAGGNMNYFELCVSSGHCSTCSFLVL